MNAYNEFKEQIDKIFESSEKEISEKLEKKTLTEDQYDHAVASLKAYLDEYVYLVKTMLTKDGMIPADTPTMRPEELVDVPFGGAKIKARPVYTPELEEQIVLDHKSVGRMFQFIKEKARKLAEHGCYGCGSDVMADFIREYYALDDKAEYEEEQKSEERKNAKAEKDRANATLNKYAERLASKSKNLEGLTETKRKAKLHSLMAKYKKEFSNPLKLQMFLSEIVEKDEDPEEVKAEITKAIQDYNKADELLKAIKASEAKKKEADTSAEDSDSEDDTSDEDTSDDTSDDDTSDDDTSAKENDSEDSSAEENGFDVCDDMDDDNPFTKAKEEEKPKKPVFFKPKKAKEQDGQINLFDLFNIQ